MNIEQMDILEALQWDTESMSQKIAMIHENANINDDISKMIDHVSAIQDHLNHIIAECKIGKDGHY
jgi:hypothetical protein